MSEHIALLVAVAALCISVAAIIIIPLCLLAAKQTHINPERTADARRRTYVHNSVKEYQKK